MLAPGTRLDREATRASARLAFRLAEEEVPVRDIGAALGVSFQRAHQLIAMYKTDDWGEIGLQSLLDELGTLARHVEETVNT